MKNIKLVQFSLLLILAITGLNAVIAQDTRPTPEERAVKMTSWMKNELLLTADQVTLIQDINVKYAVENELLRSSSQRKLSKYKAFKKRQDAKEFDLKRVLTAEQFSTYLDKRADLKKKMKAQWKESGK